MNTLLLFLLYLFSIGNAYLTPSCMRVETISWAAGKQSEIRAVNLTACGVGSHQFQIDRPVNSTKSMRARIVAQEEDSDHTLVIRVFEEGVGADGQIRNFQRKSLDGVDDSVISSPYTSLKLFVHKIGQRAKAEMIIQFTLEDGGCPYPFLESRIGSPLIITSEVLANECDFSVTAVDPGAALELTSINDSIPHQRHSAAVVVYDGYTQERLHRIEQSEFDRELKEHLGTSKVTIHVTNPQGGDKSHDVTFITINSIHDDCQCPMGNVTLNQTDSVYKFQMEKYHCFHLNCTVYVQLAEPLRHNYRLKAYPSYASEPTDTFAISDGGMADYYNFKYIPNPRYFISAHPNMLLSYNEGKQPSHDSVTVTLEPTTEAEQALCGCPAEFVSNLLLTIDPSCPPMDCLWSLPKLDYQYIPTIAVDSNASTDDPYEELYMMTTHEQAIRWIKLQNGDFEALYIPWEDELIMQHVIIHYHRMWREHPNTGKRQSAPSFYKMVVSSHYNITGYSNDCGCYNSTIKLDQTSEFNFTSPRYPFHYCNNLNCRTIFEAPEGYRVVFRPHKLSLQRKGDYLNLFDLIDGKEIRRERYSGTYLDGFTTESRTNKLLAVFLTDASIAYDGFNSTVYAAKMDDVGEDYFDDSQSSSTSGVWFWKILFCLFIVGAIVGGVMYKRRKSEGLSLSFSPVSFMNGGDYDEGSVSFFSS